MRAVGIKKLKDRLSEYVRIAEAGETVLVIDRDRVVAELRPPAAGRPKSAPAAVLADLVQDGLLQLPTLKLASVPEVPAMAPLPLILEELGRDRDD
ncbi:MAG: hypothetical protein K1X75_17645 [Leptospirales bacterium]|nr:hypothetical protein [Leptospirales bacterium]